MHSVINFVLFQAVWFCALLFEHASLIPNALLIAVMFYFSKQKKQDSYLLIVGLVIALSFEYLMVQLGLLSFKVDPFPLWLAFLWCALLLCLNTSMQFLTQLPWYASLLLCAVFSPASYWAGARFEVLFISLPLWQFWLMYGLGWAVMFTGLMSINRYMGKRIVVAN